MRRFFLSVTNNGTTTNYDLNSKTSLFLSDVTGLGSTSSLTFADNNNGFFTMTDGKPSQQEIVGTLNIMSTAYDTYHSFVNNIMNAEKIVFKYQYGATLYNCDVKLSYITKTELNHGKYLACPIAFRMCSLWYNETSYGSVGGVSNISVSEQMPCGLYIRITGTALTNPQIKIQEMTGTPATLTDFEEINITDELIASDILEYSSFSDDMYVKKNGSDELPNVDTSVRIFQQTTKAMRITVTDDNDAEPDFTVIQRGYWRTV